MSETFGASVKATPGAIATCIAELVSGGSVEMSRPSHRLTRV